MSGPCKRRISGQLPVILPPPKNGRPPPDTWGEQRPPRSQPRQNPKGRPPPSRFALTRRGAFAMVPARVRTAIGTEEARPMTKRILALAVAAALALVAGVACAEGLSCCCDGPAGVCCKAACACCKDCCCGKDCGCAKKGKCCGGCGCALATSTVGVPGNCRMIITRIIRLASPTPCPAMVAAPCCPPPAPPAPDFTWYAPTPPGTGVYVAPPPHGALMIAPPPVVYPHPTTFTPPMPPPPAVVCMPAPACQWTLHVGKRAEAAVKQQAGDDASDAEPVIHEEKAPCLVLECCGEMQARCDSLTLKTPAGQEIKVTARGDHIRISGAGYEARCESLSRAA